MNQSGEVIFLTSEFPPMYGGIGSQAFNIYKELSKNNYTISIIAPFAKSELEKGVINNKDRIFRYRTNPLFKLVSITFFIIKLLLKNRSSILNLYDINVFYITDCKYSFISSFIY